MVLKFNSSILIITYGIIWDKSHLSNNLWITRWSRNYYTKKWCLMRFHGFFSINAQGSNQMFSLPFGFILFVIPCYFYMNELGCKQWCPSRYSDFRHLWNWNLSSLGACLTVQNISMTNLWRTPNTKIYIHVSLVDQSICAFILILSWWLLSLLFINDGTACYHNILFVCSTLNIYLA